MVISEETRRSLLDLPLPTGGPPLWIPVDAKGKPVEDPNEAVDFRPSRVGFLAALEELYHFLTLRDTEEILLYDGRGLYNGGAKPFIKEWIELRFKDLEKTADLRFCNETVDSVRRSTYRERVSLNPEGLICLWNGILDLRSGRRDRVDHDPGIPFVTRLPVVYDPTAKCPRFQTFLERVLPDDRWRSVVQEMFGYCLKPGNPYKTAFFLVGPHDSGKSTLLEVLRGVLGAENTATIALQALADNKFAAAGLYGRLANIYTDLSPKLIRDAGLFKMLTGGSDHVPAEKKFQDAFSFVNPAKLLFSANTMPAVAWGDTAFFRRWAVIELVEQIPLPEQIAFYEAVLLEEAPGILNWALDGLDRLSTRGHFDTEGVLANTRTRWRRLSDSLVWFVEDRLERERTALIAKSELYASYTQFCEDQGVEARSQTDVGCELPQLLPGVHATVAKPGGRADKSVRSWMGLRLRSGGLEDSGSTPASGGLENFGSTGSTGDSAGSAPSGSTGGSTGSTPTSGMTYLRARESSSIPELPVEPVEPVEPGPPRPDPGDLFKDRSTRADRARRALERGGTGP
jgi:P4 family phage/plasmid primase-like protien